MACLQFIYFWGILFLFEAFSNVNENVADHGFCHQQQVNATFCIQCGSDVPDTVEVYIIANENEPIRNKQLMCLKPHWQCRGLLTGTYNTTSDELEITFLFNHTIHAGRYLLVIRKGNGNKEVQKLHLKACISGFNASATFYNDTFLNVKCQHSSFNYSNSRMRINSEREMDIGSCSKTDCNGCKMLPNGIQCIVLYNPDNILLCTLDGAIYKISMPTISGIKNISHDTTTTSQGISSKLSDSTIMSSENTKSLQIIPPSQSTLTLFNGTSTVGLTTLIKSSTLSQMSTPTGSPKSNVTLTENNETSPEITATPPDTTATSTIIKDTPPDITATLPGITITSPDSTTTLSEIRTAPPVINVTLTEMNTTLPEINATSPDITEMPLDITSNSPNIDTSSPEINGTSPYINTNLPNINATLPEIPPTPLDITAIPQVSTPTLPMINKHPQEFNATSPVINIASLEINKTSPKIIATSPEINTISPMITVTPPDITTSLSEIHATSPEITKSPLVNTSNLPEIDTNLPEINATLLDINATLQEIQLTPSEITTMPLDITSNSPNFQEITSTTPEITPTLPDIKATLPVINTALLEINETSSMIIATRQQNRSTTQEITGSPPQITTILPESNATSEQITTTTTSSKTNTSLEGTTINKIDISGFHTTMTFYNQSYINVGCQHSSFNYSNSPIRIKLLGGDDYGSCSINSCDNCKRLPDGIECNVPYTPGQTLQCILDGTIYNLTEANSTSKANSPTTQSITTSTLEKSTSSESSQPSPENIMTSKETQTTSALDSQTMRENTQESTKPKTSSDLIYDNNGTRIVLSLILIPSCFFIVYEFVYRK